MVETSSPVHMQVPTQVVPPLTVGLAVIHLLASRLSSRDRGHGHQEDLVYNVTVFT